MSEASSVAPLISAYLAALAAVFTYMTAAFLVALRLGRSDIADVAWGLGFVGVCATMLLGSGGGAGRGRLLLMSVLTTIWGIRLAWHIASRRRGKPQDFRYAGLEPGWCAAARMYVRVFLVQGGFMLLVSAPIVFAGAYTGPSLGSTEVLGVAIWVFGFAFEAIADAQLAAFKRKGSDSGRVIQTGLWSWSRHPNYFGETVLWWGAWIIALRVPYGWAAVIGPLTITWLLLGISGIPMLERRYADDAEYQEYARRVSVFLPRPPRG